MSADGSRSVGVLLVAMASLTLLGWIANVAWLVQPFQTFPPFRVASAMGLLALGVGIATSAYPSVRWLSITCGCLALVFGSLPIQNVEGLNWLRNTLASVESPTFVSWHGEQPSQMALSSAVFVFLGGVGLLAILSKRRGLWPSIVLAAAGGIVMLLATTVIAGQALGLLEGASFGSFLGSSLQSTLCALVFATHFNALAWTKHAGFSPPPSWLPLSVGAGSMVTVVFVWRALLGSEAAQLAEQSRVAALATRSAVNRQMMVAQRNLRRMSRYSVTPDERWTVVTTQLVEDIAGLESVAWTDSLGHPRGGDHRVVTGAFAKLEPVLRAHVSEFRTPTDQAKFIAVPSDPSRALMVLPRCVSQQCGDLFVGVVNASAILGAVLTDTVLGFDMAIGNRETWFRGSAPIGQIV